MPTSQKPPSKSERPMAHRLTMKFVGATNPVLIFSQFDGNDPNQPESYASDLRFEWSKAVKAFAYAIVMHKAAGDSAASRKLGEDEKEQPMARSLGQSLEQKSRGTIARFIPDDLDKIFLGTRRRPNHLPVKLAINCRLLPPENVEIFLDKRSITEPHLLRGLADDIYNQENWNELPVFRRSGKGFSPVRTLDSPVGDFTGRDDEKQQLISALRSRDGVRIIMIHGMPGSGKTQLALVVAREIGSLFPGHHLLVKLRLDRDGSAAEALTVALRSLKGFGFDLPLDVDELRNSYLRSLAGTKSLILIDNAVETAAVEKLVPPDGCGLIVTSRERIAIDGPVAERIDRLDELKTPEAESLLTGICPRVPSSIAEKICRYCGYLPLAIRAAGNLLDITVDLDPAQYAAELENEHDRLDRIGHTGVPIGVEASFNLSYERLDPKTKKVFQTLAVLPASFDNSAEVAVCDDTGNAHLHELVRRALVNFLDKSKRYVLHDLMEIVRGQTTWN